MPSWTKEEQFRRVEDSFIELSKGSKLLAFYPPGHPQRKAVLEKVHGTIRSSIQPGEEMVIEFAKEGASWEKKPLGLKSEQAISAGKEFFLRKIKRLRISGNVSLAEVSALITVLNLDRDELESQGGAENFLLRQAVKNIRVQEIHYERIKEKSRDAKDQGGEEKEGPSPEQGQVFPESDREYSIEDILASEEKEAVRLLGEMEGEADHARYLALLKRLVKSCRKFVAAKRSEMVFGILQSLDSHVRDASRHDVQRRYAREALSALGDPRAISLLIEHFATKSVYSADDYANVFLTLGDKAISCLIEDLTTREELKARRRVADMVTRFEEKALPRILPLLKDSRWYVVRNMISLLGEIKAVSSVSSLKETLRHPDLRVRKECIKTLSGIRSKEAMNYLFDVLHGKDEELAASCASILGALKETQAVEPLMAIVKNSRNKALQIEAIMSMGKIGSHETVPYLVKTLRKGRFLNFGSRVDIRASAALALGEIGGPEALKALERGSMSGNKILKEACWQGLKIMDEKLGGI